MIKLKTASIEKKAMPIILTLIIIVILFKAYAAIIPEAQTAGDSISDSEICSDGGGYYNLSGPIDGITCYNETPHNVNSSAVDVNYIPLSGIFSSTGVIFALIMAGLVMLIIYGVFKKT